jgi:hypothetical protein
MCYALYAASDQPLPIVPWDAAQPAFYAQPPDENDAIVVRQFALPHVVYLGAHTGCGCGFINDEAATDSAATQSCTALASYLAAARTRGAVEVFLCWEGGQEVPAKTRTHVAAADFLRHPFPLAEDEVATLA